MLPKKKRLSTIDFKGIKPKIIIRGSLFDIAHAFNKDTKFACVISKKQIKIAVLRNKAKRRVYSILEGVTPKITGFFIIYPKKTILHKDFKEVKEEMLHQLT